jgi:multiple sugar transport system ATP-binding protein
MIAGLEDISGGEIRIGDRVVNNVPPKERDAAEKGAWANIPVERFFNKIKHCRLADQIADLDVADAEARLEKASGALLWHEPAAQPGA